MDFTPSQQRAIGFDLANLQLIACAGSGKAEVRRVNESLGDLPSLAEMFVGTIHALALETIVGCVVPVRPCQV
jgi:hypothetical protein